MGFYGRNCGVSARSACLCCRGAAFDGLAFERRNDGTQRVRDPFQVIPAFRHCDDPALTTLVSDRRNPRRQTAETPGLEAHPGQRVVLEGIEP